MAPTLPRLSWSSSSSSAAGGGDAVDAIIAEAADLVALEQVAKLNTAHLSDSNLLPSDLESRFRKLKSFPASIEKENIPRSLDRSETAPVSAAEVKNPEPLIAGGDLDELENVAAEAPEKPKSDLGSSPSSFSFGSLSDSLSPSPSPPKRRCCFGCSPKKVVLRRKGKKGDDILSELGVVTLTAEQRKMKKVLKEQEKAIKEAEKVVEWVKQASLRMRVTATDELPTDDDDDELK